MAQSVGPTGSARLPQAGDLLAGKYRIVREIGEGGMGVVFEARHERLEQRFAIKVLRIPDSRDVDESLARFDREARAAAKLSGRNVARVSDVDALDDGTPFIVMELLDGVGLDVVLDARELPSVKEAVGYVLQSYSAVAEAHAQGIIHRDLKPHNLFLVGGSEAPVIKLLDFGISKIEDEREQSVTLTRASLGTPAYMSPEQIRSSRNADERSDIWSLGVILYELLSGRTPFDGENPSSVIAAISADAPVPLQQVMPGLPRGLCAAVMKALEKEPSHRYQTVTELADALLPFGPQGAWSQPPPAPPTSEARTALRNAPTVMDVRFAREGSGRDLPPVAITQREPPVLGSRAAPRARRGDRRRLVALLAVACIAGALFWLTRPAEPQAAVPERTGSVAAVERPRVVVAPKPASVTIARPGVQPAPVAGPEPAPTASPRVAARPAKVHRPAAPPRAASPRATAAPPKSAAPAPPPAPASENPLHL